MIEQADLILAEIEEKMSKAVDSTAREFANIRTGRANPAILDRVLVPYYGIDTPIRQVASITVPEGNQLYIKPFDKNVLKDLEQAILSSQLGLTPLGDGEGIRLVIPTLTQDRRKALVKDVEKLSETGKVNVRNIRREGNDLIKKIGLNEDDEHKYLQEIQKLTDDHIKRNEEETKKKSEEILTI